METSINNKCKAFTSLEQSKKLAEILPLESADMEYMFLKKDNSKVSNVPFVKDDDEPEWPDDGSYDFIPCWSLTALLGVLPYHLIIDNKRYEFRMIKGLNKNGETYAIEYVIFNTTFYFHLTGFYNNPIDACFAMIIRLHELNGTQIL